jgi:hypothetical protein
MTSKTTQYSSNAEKTTMGRSPIATAFNDISEPGTYYNHDTGWLVRIPEEALSPGHSPFLNVVSRDLNFVTKISDDPWIPVNKARQLCSNLDFMVNF